MKALPHLFSKLFSSQLMLHAPTRVSFERHLLAHMGVARPLAEHVVSSPRADVGDPGKPMGEWLKFSQDYAATQEQLRIDAVYTKLANVAVVKIHGVIDKMISQFEMDCYGGCDLADVDKSLSLAANDPSVDTVLLWVESPGGSVTGTPETAARVAALQKTKEVHAYTGTICCSAAYYIASQADMIVAAPSAIVGSIGVYMAVLDETRALEMEGYKVELIKAGSMKAMGASFKPLADDERAFLQAGVDQTYATFKGAVNKMRPDVADSTMQGQWFDGATAMKLQLVDQNTAASADEYAARLLLN